MALSHRSLVRADIPAIREVMDANRPLFSDDEVKTALEMIDEALAAKPGAEDPYQFVVTERAEPSGQSKVVAFACFGTIPLTKGTFDLYWIAVHPGTHGGGVGKKRLVQCEDEIRRQGGHLMVVETSSRKDYDKTRRFYEKTMAYATAAWIKDFYKPGDDKVIYVKYLSPAGDRPA